LHLGEARAQTVAVQFECATQQAPCGAAARIALGQLAAVMGSRAVDRRFDGGQ
jgi:hypothetical protein